MTDFSYAAWLADNEIPELASPLEKLSPAQTRQRSLAGRARRARGSNAAVASRRRKIGAAIAVGAVAAGAAGAGARYGRPAAAGAKRSYQASKYGATAATSTRQNVSNAARGGAAAGRGRMAADVSGARRVAGRTAAQGRHTGNAAGRKVSAGVSSAGGVVAGHAGAAAGANRTGKTIGVNRRTRARAVGSAARRGR
jgi:hypothetical protein